MDFEFQRIKKEWSKQPLHKKKRDGIMEQEITKPIFLSKEVKEMILLEYWKIISQPQTDIITTPTRIEIVYENKECVYCNKYYVRTKIGSWHHFRKYPDNQEYVLLLNQELYRRTKMNCPNCGKETKAKKYDGYCKKCRPFSKKYKEYNKQYREKNREKLNIRQKQWYEKNKEQQKKYREKNKEKRKEWYKKNKETGGGNK